MQVQQNFPLKHYNTFGINSYSKYFAAFQSVEELKSFLEESGETTPKMILGGGSNILFTKDYNGLVLKNEIAGIELINEDDEFVYVRAGAGISWHSLVLFCVENNYGGVENLSLIPGNVGATPMQNIGAYGVEIKDVFYELEAFQLEEKTVLQFKNPECEFGYRESVFKKKYKNQFAILNVTYRLRKQPVFNTNYGAIEEELNKMNIKDLSVKAISDAVIRIRKSKLPNPEILGNAGSFFKNPVVNKEEFLLFSKTQFARNLLFPHYQIDDNHFKIPAGWLIEQCGWKGYRKDDAGCYEKQALVLVNYGKATGREIYNLSEVIIASVKEKFAIYLEREVNIL